MKQIKSKILVFLLVSVLVYAILLAIHAVATITVFDVHKVFLFHFIIALHVIGITYFVHQKFPLQTGFAFLGMITLKLLMAGIYLAPHLKSEVVYPKPDLLLFAAGYVLYMGYELYFTIQLLKQK